MSAVTGFITENGRDLFAGERKYAYDGGGVAFDHEITDVEEMLNTAGINFHFHLSPVFDDLGNEIAGQHVNYRTMVGGKDDGKRVHAGIVGDRYVNLDPLPALQFLQVMHGKHPFIGAGAFEKGSRIFAQMRFTDDFTIGGVKDIIKGHATVFTTFDGSGAVKVGFGPVRIDCKNVLNVALRGMTNVLSFRHTASIEEKMHNAAEMEGKGKAYLAAFKDTAEDMFKAKYSDKQYENAFLTLFPKPKKNTKGSETKWENKRAMYMQAWKHDTRANLRGTAWGAFNALTEANQWGRNIQKTEKGEENFWAAGMGLDIPTNKFRQKALALVASRAGVEV